MQKRKVVFPVWSVSRQRGGVPGVGACLGSFVRGSDFSLFEQKRPIVGTFTVQSLKKGFTFSSVVLQKMHLCPCGKCRVAGGVQDS